MPLPPTNNISYDSQSAKPITKRVHTIYYWVSPFRLRIEGKIVTCISLQDDTSRIFPINPLSARRPRCLPRGIAKFPSREHGKHTTFLFHVRIRPTVPEVLFLVGLEVGAVNVTDLLL